MKREYATSLTDRQHAAELRRKRYRANADYRLASINRMRRTRGKPEATSLDEIEARV